MHAWCKRYPNYFVNVNVMKSVLRILFILLLSFRAFGQNSEDQVVESYFVLTTKEINIENSATELSHAQKKVLFEIVKGSTNYFCLGEPEEYSTKETYENYLLELYSKFKFIDIDNDSDLDIVFHGLMCSGHESESILIYLNKNNNYERVILSSGKFVDFVISKEFIIYKYPCCAMIENTLEKYEIQKDTIINVFNLIFYNSPVLHIHNKEYENIMPSRLKKERDIILFSGTEINYIPKERINKPTHIQKNLILKTEKEIKVSVFAHYIDNEGDIWVYCKIPAQTDQTNGTTNYFFAWTKKQNYR
jgi:hypothetical protein